MKRNAEILEYKNYFDESIDDALGEKTVLEVDVRHLGVKNLFWR